MATEWTFGISGVAVQIEDEVPGTQVHRRAYGTEVTAPAGAEMWFHFPLTAPSEVANDDRVKTKTVGLRLYLSDHTTLYRLHVLHGGAGPAPNQGNYIRQFDHDAVNAADRGGLEIRGPRLVETGWPLPRDRAYLGLVVSVLVKWEDNASPQDGVRFIGATGELVFG